MQIFLLFFQYFTDFRSVACTFLLAKISQFKDICYYLCAIVAENTTIWRTFCK